LATNNWEQGRREPTGPAKALLRAIRNDPKAVLSALPVQHAPHINVAWMLDVEQQVRIVRQRPDTQTRQIQFVRVARRPAGRMATDVRIGLLQRVNECQCRLFSPFAQVMGNRVINVAMG